MAECEEKSSSSEGDDIFGDSLISQVSSILWDEDTVSNSFINDVIPFEILDSPAKAIESQAVQGEKFKKVTNASLQEILDYVPKEEAIRKIYYTSALDFEEARVLGRFQEYLLMQGLTLADWVFTGDILALKCLNACDRSFRKTYKRLLMIIEHEDKVKSFKIVDHIDFLNSGAIYSLGRDRELRPIIIVNLLKFIQTQENLEKVLNSCFYFFDYVKYNLLVPGRVETWVILIDCSNIKTSDFNKKQIKNIIKNMGRFYPCRLDVMLIINLPNFLKALWKLALVFVKKSTYNKIKITSKKYSEEILQKIDRTQLEKKFGGKVNDKIRQFFPPRSKL